MKINNNGFDFIAGLLFVGIAVILGAITIWGIFTLNAIVATLGGIAEGAWFYFLAHT